MFVRYRKLQSDGIEPRGVERVLACAGRCQRRRDLRCPMKPRCRWRISADLDALALVPYRLQVSIVENRRIDGKVRQEHIADLGSIDAWLIPEFWEGIAPTIVLKIKQENWDLHSTIARVAFWENAKPRLERLANRLDPQIFRMAIHARVPWPKQAERDLAEAREDYREWKQFHGFQTEFIKRKEKYIAHLTAQINEHRELEHKYARYAADVAQRLAKLCS